MDIIGSVAQLFRTTLITIPFMQLFLLIVVSTLFLLFRSLKFALLTNYLFTFYWGFSANFGKINFISTGNFPLFSFLYLGFGFMVAILVLLSFRHTTS